MEAFPQPVKNANMPVMLCRAGRLFLVAIPMWLAAAPATQAMPPLRIVAVGASNAHGWYVGKGASYPALLQTLLKAKGIDAHVTNAGVPFDATAMMLTRLHADVPAGTDIAILQLGGNDLRFFGTRERGAANIAAMVQQLRARSIEVIVCDEPIPLRYYTLDCIHLTHEGHGMIAAALLPRVIEQAGRRNTKASIRFEARFAQMPAAPPSARGSCAPSSVPLGCSNTAPAWPMVSE
jgi:acyl-CoA thioesterase-1